MKNGLFGRIAAKNKMLRDINRSNRLKFPKEHRDLKKDDWHRVLSTDESEFEQFGNKQCAYMRQRIGERYKNECLVPTVKYVGGNIMV